MEKHFFTLQEARKLLPRVRGLVEQMAALAEQLGEYRAEVEFFAGRNEENTGGRRGAEYVQTVLALRGCVTELQGLGCLVKDVEEGLIDFPHMMEGREVCLCWKKGEGDIRFWHEVDAGFAGRHPIDES